MEYKERLTRFGFRYLDTLVRAQGRASEAANQPENGIEDLLAGLTAMVHSFCATLSVQRRAMRKTEAIVRQFEAKEEADAIGGTPDHQARRSPLQGA